MRARNGTAVLLAVVGTFAIAGCGSREARPTPRAPIARAANMDAPGTTNTTSAALTTSSVAPKAKAPISTASAVMRVATERCDRLATCKHVGTGRAFGDRDECVNAIGHDLVAALSDDECPSGVDAERLAACVAEVKASSCEDGAESVAPLPACQRAPLCRSEVARSANAAPTQTER